MGINKVFIAEIELIRKYDPDHTAHNDSDVNGMTSPPSLAQHKCDFHPSFSLPAHHNRNILTSIVPPHSQSNDRPSVHLTNSTTKPICTIALSPCRYHQKVRSSPTFPSACHSRRRIPFPTSTPTAPSHLAYRPQSRRLHPLEPLANPYFHRWSRGLALPTHHLLRLSHRHFRSHQRRCARPPHPSRN